jgi:hypothetical protein
MKAQITLTFESSANLASFYAGKFEGELRSHGAKDVDVKLTTPESHKQITLQDLFTIEYDETDDDWFRVIAKSEFDKHRIRLISSRAHLDFHHGGKEESISIIPKETENMNKKFNSMVLESYDKKPEQGYAGFADVYLTIKEVKAEKKVKKK